MMTIEEYETAMKRVNELMDAEAGSPEAEELSALADRIVVHEEKHFPIDADVTCSCIDFHGEDPACKLHHAESH
jgi:HTH-type transcriptional regulator/antitoxin HigA